MDFYKNDLLNHFRHILPAIEDAGADATLDAKTFHLKLRLAGKLFVLQPQFIQFKDGKKQYTPIFGSHVRRFIGWCPYFNKRWPLANEKLQFKAYALANGLATPGHSVDPNPGLADVIVKKNVSSFAMGIKGPFRNPAECPLDPAAGEFYERFVPGRSAKIFYWESRPVCLELEKPASVVGDGRSTLQELVDARAALRGTKLKRGRTERYLRYVGRTFGDVLPAGAVQQVDFRYGSALNQPSDRDDIDLTRKMPRELASQLEAIGERLWLAIPADIRKHTLYTVDGVLDAEDRLWLTEMNSNPFIHPFLYPVILEALLGNAAAAQAASPQADVPAESADEVLHLAMVQFNSGAVDEALALWGRALKVRPNHPAALYYSSLVLARGGRFAEAKGFLETLVETAEAENLYLQPARQLLTAIAQNAFTAGAPMAGPMPAPGWFAGNPYPSSH
jgi:tetratricopeptide (TPR) repeat protein